MSNNLLRQSFVSMFHAQCVLIQRIVYGIAKFVFFPFKLLKYYFNCTYHLPFTQHLCILSTVKRLFIVLARLSEQTTISRNSIYQLMFVSGKEI